jgi:hypothetical protein
VKKIGKWCPDFIYANVISSATFEGVDNNWPKLGSDEIDRI